jgi:Protein of unknown function (DUF3667)
MQLCKNCSVPVVGVFCHACGQKAETQRLDWHWLGHELQHSVFHVDKGILYTLKELFLRPGHTIGGYLAGKRKRHFPPLSLILVLAAVYSVLFAFFKPDMSAFAVNPQSQKTMELITELMTSKYALFELTLLPLVSFWSWLLMRKYGHNFVEHVVINAFLGGQRILMNVLALPVNKLGAGASMMVSGVLFVVYFGYFVFGFAQLYQEKNSARVALRAMAAFALFWVVTLLLIATLTVAFMVATKGSFP